MRSRATPAVLLLDEPMAALDAHTRAGVRAELQELLRELDLPTILVTHDFEDAAVLADRVGVLVEGRLLQLGTPDELVAAPADAFVAELHRRERARTASRARRADGLTEVVLDDGAVVFSTDRGEAGSASSCTRGRSRSRRRVAPADSALNHVRAPIASLVTIGNRVRVRVGPLVGEVTAASVERLDLERGRARRRLVQGDRRAARSPARRLNASNVRAATASGSV